MSNVHVFPFMWAMVCDDCDEEATYEYEDWAEEAAESHECGE